MINMWVIIMLVSLIAALMGLAYLVKRVSTYRLIQKLAHGKKGASVLLAFLALIVFVVILVVSLGQINAGVVLLNVVMFSLLAKLFVAILDKVFLKKKKALSPADKSSLAAVLTILVSVIYLSVGWYQGHHVYLTEYDIATDKKVEPMSVLLMADLHVGTTFDGESFKKHAEYIQSLQPDVIVISGDFIDGNATYEDTKGVCDALGTIKTKYGIFFAYGNHDKNTYGEDVRRSFTSKQLAEMLTENHVTILEDEMVTLPNGYSIIGRRDKSQPVRTDISELAKKADANTFQIVLDHQPNDYTAEAAAKVDLVLSGHTHGGQLIPINRVGELIGANDKTYGYEKRDQTNFIVTSGISAWEIDFKTGCHSEVVMIHIQ